MKTCSKCGVEKPLAEFYKHKATRDRLRAECKTCWKQLAEVRRKTNPTTPEQNAKWAADLRRRCRDNPEPYRARRRVRTLKQYGLTEVEYEAMVAEQNRLCAICQKPMVKVNVDHDHATKQIRGLLCHWCNLGLGNFKDSEIALIAAIEYLRKSKEQTQTNERLEKT